MSIWKEKKKRSCILTDLGMLWDFRGGAGKHAGEREFWTTLLNLLQLRVDSG